MQKTLVSEDALTKLEKARQKELAKAKAEGEEAINAATTPEEAANALSDAKKAINLVETKAQKAEKAYQAEVKKAKAVKVTIKKAKAKGNSKAEVKWKKASGISGYQIVCSTSKKFSKKTTKTVRVDKNANSKMLKKLKAGKKYYVKVRTYKLLINPVNGKDKRVYGKWSKGKKFKTK